MFVRRHVYIHVYRFLHPTLFSTVRLSSSLRKSPGGGFPLVPRGLRAKSSSTLGLLERITSQEWYPRSSGTRPLSAKTVVNNLSKYIAICTYVCMYERMYVWMKYIRTYVQHTYVCCNTYVPTYVHTYCTYV